MKHDAKKKQNIKKFNQSYVVTLYFHLLRLFY